MNYENYPDEWIVQHFVILKDDIVQHYKSDINTALNPLVLANALLNNGYDVEIIDRANYFIISYEGVDMRLGREPIITWVDDVRFEDEYDPDDLCEAEAWDNICTSQYYQDAYAIVAEYKRELRRIRDMDEPNDCDGPCNYIGVGFIAEIKPLDYPADNSDLPWY